jgi:hypothetical protein
LQEKLFSIALFAQLLLAAHFGNGGSNPTLSGRRLALLPHTGRLPLNTENFPVYLSSRSNLLRKLRFFIKNTVSIDYNISGFFDTSLKPDI